MACGILILLWVKDELSYDRFNRHHDRIFRVTRQLFNQDGTLNMDIGHTAYPIAPLLLNDFPDIVHSVRLNKMDRTLVHHEESCFEEERLFFAEKEIFKVFTFPLLRGDPQTALARPFSVVLDEPSARRYFGDTDPWGRIIQLNFYGREVDLTVTGVMKAVPRNSHFHPQILVSLETWDALSGRRWNGWGNNRFLTYILVPESYDIRLIENRLDWFMKKNLPPERNFSTLGLQKLTDIHLRSHLDSEVEPNGDFAYIVIFSLAALFILLIACGNYINLATARSSVRSREVGVRKVVGANRGQLIRQFFSESVLVTLLALGLALVFVYLSLPGFGMFTGKYFAVSFSSLSSLGGVLVGVAVVVGLISGIYPALFLSAFQPVRTFKRGRRTKRRSVPLRSVLVVLQFSISITLIICMNVVSGQLDFIRNKKLGFQKEHIVILPSDDSMSERWSDIKTRLKIHPGILSVTASKHIPSDRLRDSNVAFTLRGDTREKVPFIMNLLRADYDYIPTFGMELVAGRNFSPKMSTDATQGFILNETAIRKMGWKEPRDAVGRPFGYGRRRGRIIGVLKDVYFESLHQSIPPFVLMIRSDERNQVAVRIRPADIPSTLAFLKRKWSEFRPHYPFTYKFLDESFDRLYRSEMNLHQVFGAFSFLAVLIACLGLLGLASFTAEQRRKEIGVRRVLGSSPAGIVVLLSREFVRWVGAANLVAWPLAFFFMRRWLQDFAYRTPLSPGPFLLAGAGALTIALATVSFQSVRAASADPVNSLRYE